MFPPLYSPTKRKKLPIPLIGGQEDLSTISIPPVEGEDEELEQISPEARGTTVSVAGDSGGPSSKYRDMAKRELIEPQPRPSWKRQLGAVGLRMIGATPWAEEVLHPGRAERMSRLGSLTQIEDQEREEARKTSQENRLTSGAEETTRHNKAYEGIMTRGQDEATKRANLTDQRQRDKEIQESGEVFDPNASYEPGTDYITDSRGVKYAIPPVETRNRMQRAQRADPRLQFSDYTDETTGTVTRIWTNPATGEEVKRESLSGLAKKREPRPPVSLMVPQGATLNPQQSSKLLQMQTGLRAEPTVKVYNDVAAGVDGIKAAAEQNNGVGDITLMRLFAKITDPTTGVREEEYRTMQGAQGALQMLQMWLTPGKWTEGMKLTPEARSAFIRMAERVQQNRLQRLNPMLSNYRRSAEAIGVPGDLVVGGVLVPGVAAPSSSTGVPTTAPKTAEEYLNSIRGK